MTEGVSDGVSPKSSLLNGMVTTIALSLNSNACCPYTTDRNNQGNRDYRIQMEFIKMYYSTVFIKTILLPSFFCRIAIFPHPV